MALACLLFGLQFSLVHVINPEGMIQEHRKVDPADIANITPLVEMPVLFFVVGLVMFWAPGVLFCLMALCTWRFVGKPLLDRSEREALLQVEQETLLQSLIQVTIETLRDSSSSLREKVYREMARTFPEIDSARRNRFLILLREGGIDVNDVPGGTTVDASLPAFKRRALLAKAGILCLMALCFFMILWGVMTMVYYKWFGNSLLKATGLPVDPLDGLFSLATCMTVAFLFFASAMGIFWLSRLDGRLAAKWRQAISAAQEEVLETYGKCLPAIRALSTRSVLSRGLALAALPGVDRDGKRRLLRRLLELGKDDRESVVDLTGADLNAANLSQLDLRGFCLRRADLRWASLVSANLSGVDLSCSDLRAADLRWANLTGSNIRGASLAYAKLHEATLSDADMRDANLTEANLWRVDLTRADLSGARVQPSQLSRARNLADSGGALRAQA
jgi:uncharacterized protein YjbI with pentapeptide repeats